MWCGMLVILFFNGIFSCCIGAYFLVKFQLLLTDCDSLMQVFYISINKATLQGHSQF